MEGFPFLVEALELPGPLVFVDRPPTDPTAVYEPTVDNG